MVQKQPSFVIYFKKLLQQPFGLFTLACLIGIFLYLVSMSITNPEYRKKYDPYDYAKVGESMWNGEGIALEGKPYVLLPPGFPFIVGAINKIIGNPETAVKVTSIIFWVLSLFLFYVFLGYFFSEQLYRWMGILLYASNYPMLFSASAGRVEPVFLFFLLLYAIMLMKKSFKEKTLQVPFTFLFFLAGLGATLYYLRPEGLYLTLVLFIIFLWRLSASKINKMIYGVYFTGCVFLLVLPYMLFLQRHTGHFQLSGKTYANLIMGEMESPYQNPKMTTDISPRYHIIQNIIDNPAEAKTVFAYITDSPELLTQRIWPNLQSLGLTVWKNYSLLGLFFVVWGIIIMPINQQIWIWAILSVWGIYLLFFVLNRLILLYQPWILTLLLSGMMAINEWLERIKVIPKPDWLVTTFGLALCVYQMRFVW